MQTSSENTVVKMIRALAIAAGLAAFAMLASSKGLNLALVFLGISSVSSVATLLVPNFGRDFATLPREAAPVALSTLRPTAEYRELSGGFQTA